MSLDLSKNQIDEIKVIPPPARLLNYLYFFMFFGLLGLSTSIEVTPPLKEE
jgi:hypothetical protein